MVEGISIQLQLVLLALKYSNLGPAPRLMGAKTPWHRGLWTPGTVLSLKEVLEASEAVQAGVLSDGSLRNLVAGTSALIGPDQALGPINAEMRSDVLFKALSARTGLNITKSSFSCAILRGSARRVSKPLTETPQKPNYGGRTRVNSYGFLPSICRGARNELKNYLFAIRISNRRHLLPVPRQR
jgi:hypothetical protein